MHYRAVYVDQNGVGDIAPRSWPVSADGKKRIAAFLCGGPRPHHVVIPVADRRIQEEVMRRSAEAAPVDLDRIVREVVEAAGVRSWRLTTTRAGRPALAPSREEPTGVLAFVEPMPGYRGGATVTIEHGGRVIAEGRTYLSPRGSLGVADAVVVAATQAEELRGTIKRSGRLYGAPPRLVFRKAAGSLDIEVLDAELSDIVDF